MSKPRRVWLAGAGAVALVVAFWLFLATPPGPRDSRVFDPDGTAALEVDMWKTYYDKRKVDLFTDLVVLTREYYRYPWVRAVRAPFHPARAETSVAEAREPGRVQRGFCRPRPC